MENEIYSKIKQILKPIIIPSQDPFVSFRLLLPGDIIYMYKDYKNQLKIEISAPSMFSHIVLSQTMLFDHFPDEYEKVLSEAEKLLESHIFI